MHEFEQLRCLVRQENESRKTRHENRERDISKFLSSLDWTQEQMDRYQVSVQGFGERYRNVIERYPKAPKLFR